MRGLDERPEHVQRIRHIVSVLERQLDTHGAYEVMLGALRRFGFALPQSALELRLFARSALHEQLLEVLSRRKIAAVLREIEQGISLPPGVSTIDCRNRKTIREKVV